MAAGDGVLALTLVSHGREGDDFAPGRVWRSIRLRLGMNVEEELFRSARVGEGSSGPARSE